MSGGDIYTKSEGGKKPLITLLSSLRSMERIFFSPDFKAEKIGVALPVKLIDMSLVLT